MSPGEGARRPRSGEAQATRQAGRPRQRGRGKLRPSFTTIRDGKRRLHSDGSPAFLRRSVTSGQQPPSELCAQDGENWSTQKHARGRRGSTGHDSCEVEAERVSADGRARSPHTRMSLASKRSAALTQRRVAWVSLESSVPHGRGGHSRPQAV